jgi:uncharacterized protein
MLKAVLDSSALVSVFLTPSGVVATLLTRAEQGAFSLCLSEAIVAETVATLMREKHRVRYRYSAERVEQFRRTLTDTAGALLRDLPPIRAVPNDPKDDMIVATAVAAGADYLVTGDRRHLLPLGTYAGVRIVTPRQFLDLLPP